MAKIRIEGGAFLTMDKDLSIIDNGTMVIENDKITEITASSSSPPASAQADEELIDARGKIILPGFINTHMHQRPLRGIGDGFGLREWHDVYVDGVSNLMTPEDAYSGTCLAFAEALKSGITTVIAEAIDPGSEFKAAQDMGIRTRMLAHIIFDDEVEEYLTLVKEQPGKKEDLVRYCIGLEVAAISSPWAIRESKKTAEKFGFRMHTHFSENVRDDIDKLIDNGYLGPDLHIAHSIQVTSADIDKLAHHEVKVAHCPTSNMKLGNGVAKVPEMRSKGISVAIASDGVLGIGRLDLFEQMRVASLIQRGTHRNSKLLSSQDVLSMITSEAAKVIGMEDEIGSLETGKKADIVIIDTNRLWLTPLVHDESYSNLIELLVWSASGQDVDTVLVNGKIKVKNGKLTDQDEQKLSAKVQKIGTRILHESKFEVYARE